jgi:ribosome-associated protein
MNDIEFRLRGEFITLDALLKATGLVGSGGAAKQLITAGEVRVDGQVDTRRGAKIRAGQCVQVAGQRVRLQPPDPAG